MGFPATEAVCWEGAGSVSGEPEGVRRDREPDTEPEGQRGGTARGNERDTGGSSIQKKETAQSEDKETETAPET